MSFPDMATSLSLIGRDPYRAADMMPLVLGGYPLHSQSELVSMSNTATASSTGTD